MKKRKAGEKLECFQGMVIELNYRIQAVSRE